MRLPSVGITCYPSQGGSGVVATELGLNLARHGFSVHFISSSLPFRLRRYTDNICYHQVEMPNYPVFQHSPYTLSLATAMADVAQNYELDILHVHYAIPHAASAFLAQQMIGPEKIKVITTLHGTDITLVGQEPSFFPITKFLIEKSDVVTTVSNFLKEETESVFGITRPIEVIPNFVDARVFTPQTDFDRHDFAAPDESLLIHISNFRKVKNLPAVIDVFEGVVRETPAKLLLVGDGPEMPMVRALLESRNLSEKVKFLGQTDNLEDIMPVADVLLLPSVQESFGLVALEAMACGVIPVVTNQGGAGEFIVDGVNGFLRSPDDVQGMISAVLNVLRDKNMKLQMAEEARRDAAADFGAPCIVKKYIELYDNLVTK